jgi:hypothetical protein
VIFARTVPHVDLVDAFAQVDILGDFAILKSQVKYKVQNFVYSNLQ